MTALEGAADALSADGWHTAVGTFGEGVQTVYVLLPEYLQRSGARWLMITHPYRGPFVVGAHTAVGGSPLWLTDIRGLNRLCESFKAWRLDPGRGEMVEVEVT